MDFWWFTAAGLQALLKVLRVLWWVFQAVLDKKHFPDFKTAEEKCKSQLWVKLKGSRSRDWQINLLKVTRTVGKTSCSAPRVRKIVSNCKHLCLWCPNRLYRFSVRSYKDTEGIDSSFEKASWRIRYGELWKNTLYPLILWRKNTSYRKKREELQTGEVPFRFKVHPLP